MIIDWWPVIALPAVLAATLFPSPVARLRQNGDKHQPATESEREHASSCREPGAIRGERRHANRATRADDWLIQLKTACEAGYYKAGSDEAVCRPPDDAACRECFFWLNDFCRFWGSQREPDAPVCSFFQASPAAAAMEHQRNEAGSTSTGDRL